MDNTVLGVGMAAILAAIVGGGLKGFGFDLPVIDSVGRQIALGAFGIILCVVGAKTALLKGWYAIRPILIPPHMETVGPISLNPGESKNFPLELSAPGKVAISLQTLTPDWTDFKGPRNQPGQDELSVSLCSSETVGAGCTNVQLGVSKVLRKELPAGPATMSVFNFGTSPRMTFEIKVSHP